MPNNLDLDAFNVTALFLEQVAQVGISPTVTVYYDTVCHSNSLLTGDRLIRRSRMIVALRLTYPSVAIYSRRLILSGLKHIALLALVGGAAAACAALDGLGGSAQDDAGQAIDAGVRVDAGPIDAGRIDARLVDAGLVDAGLIDAGQPDAGLLIDAGQPDANVPILRLLKARITTVGPSNQTGGSLRVVNDGFEHSQQNCAGTLCVIGGIGP